MTQTDCIIRSRYGSTRFPGKVLQLLGGKPVIQWVCEAALATPGIASVLVATDDERIVQAVPHDRVRVLYTSSQCRSGSERVAEVLRSISTNWVIHLQADEPLIRPEHLFPLVEYGKHEEAKFATLATRCASLEEANSPNTVKVVWSKEGNALYFSRSPIPFDAKQWWKHIGVYAYRPEVFLHILAQQPSPAEEAENLEQLRFLHYGIPVRVFPIQGELISIDTPEDLERAQKFLERMR